MADLYLDTEFNGHGGQLLSLALANPAKGGKHFHARLPDPPEWHPWVKGHVVRNFGIEPTDRNKFRCSLMRYLQRRAPVTIYANWPADFQLLTEIMCGAALADSWSVECQMVLLRGTDTSASEVPHNALSDAIALMEWHQGLLSRGNYKSAIASWAA